MGRCDQLRTLCCTVEGLRKLKKAFTMIVGTAFITVAVLSLVLNPLGIVANFPNFIRMVWNIFFGVLMLMLQFGKTEWLIHRFGFMGHWVGRALFFLFCGTNILVVENDGYDWFFCFISWVFGGMCMFVGILEIVFGCRCEGENLSRNTSSQQGGQYAGQNAAMPPADQQQQQPPAAKKKSGFSSVFSSGGSGGGSGGSGGSDGSDGTLSRSDTALSGFSSTAGETSLATERSSSGEAGGGGGGGGEAAELLSAAGAAGPESSEGGGSCVRLLGAEASPARWEGGAAGVAAPVPRRPIRERVAALECRI